ncbi:MAG: hypothetical protein M3Q73_02930 [bacterium]|nr:hypothetical protein [bacterium]
MSSNTFKKTAVLAGLFIVLIIGGRLIYKPSDADQKAEITPVVEDSQTVAPVAKTEPKQTIAPKAADESEETLASCTTRLRQETTAKKTEYEKGTMLVTFNTGMTYTQAKDMLATYGITVKNETSAKSSFQSRNLITGAFTPGEEFTKICLMRRDERVRFAGLNVIFNLHE